LRKTIIYYGGRWPTNIGNAFIDYGALYTIKKACPTAEIHLASGFSRWLCLENRRDLNNCIDLAQIMHADYLVVSGSMLTSPAIKTFCPILRELARRGTRIILNGCGGALYSEKEIKDFKGFLNDIKAYGFISRDRNAYDTYKGYCEKSFDGIDCAFFLSDAFRPAPLQIRDFVVYNFDHINEPPIIEEHERKIIRTNHSTYRFFPNTVESKGIFFAFSTRFPFVRAYKPTIKKLPFKNMNLLVSDFPEDYLNLYAHAHAVYSDKVHVCIAALSFGNLARLYLENARVALFEKVGAYFIKEGYHTNSNKRLILKLCVG